MLSEAGKALDPKSVLMNKINEKYCMDEVTNLSADLLDNLSAKKVNDAQLLSDDFYEEYYSPKNESSEE